MSDDDAPVPPFPSAKMRGDPVGQAPAARLTTSRRRADGLRKGKDVMTFRHFFTFFLGIVLALTLVPAAQAANLFIDDSVDEQITLNHDPNWEFGVLSNGTPFPGFVAGSTTAPGEVATFSGSWQVNSPGNPDPGTGIIYFVDQAANKAAKKAAKNAGKNAGKKNSCKRRKDRRRRHRSVCVSDIVTANWSTVVQPGFDTATISFTIISSACGRNLGPLPRHFAGLGVPDPASPIEISGLFRNLVTAAPVAIPSNLTVQFVGKADTACKRDKGDDDKADDKDARRQGRRQGRRRQGRDDKADDKADDDKADDDKADDKDDDDKDDDDKDDDDEGRRLRTQRPSANEGRAALAALPSHGMTYGALALLSYLSRVS